MAEFVNKKIKVTVGVFKGATGVVRVYEPANNAFLISFDDKTLCLDEIHFYKNEIEILQGDQ